MIAKKMSFREWVTDDGTSRLSRQPKAAIICMSHGPVRGRTGRSLFGASGSWRQVVGMSVVDPIRDDRGWAFREGPWHTTDPVNGFQVLERSLLGPLNPNFQSRVTVPVLWDSETKKIVSNSDDDIMRMFNEVFKPFTESSIDLYPTDLRQRD